MSLRHLAEIAKEGFRPFTGYGGAVSLFAALFAPQVSAEKMLVIAGLVGGLGYMRTMDKKAALQAGAGEPTS